MKSKLIRLNEIQILILDQYLSDVKYYLMSDHYSHIDSEKKMKNDVIMLHLTDIQEKLKFDE